MGKILVVAEKPSVGADIARVLGCKKKCDGYIEGEQYVISWAVGHLIGLKNPEEFKEDYKRWELAPLPFAFPVDESLKVLDGTKKQFKVLKELINRDDITMLINAGDAGREGYLIQEWIYRMAGNKKPKKVLWANSMTEEALLKAFNHLHETSEFDSLLEEAECRAVGDWMMGMNYSRALTLILGNGKALRYGRCQTPLLNLICQREDEIGQFKPVPYFEVESVYENDFTGSMKNAEKFMTREEAEKALPVGRQGKVKSYVCEDKEESAPTLFSLGELQKHMGKKYGYSPDETLVIAQALYETYKVTTYPRTDSKCLTTDLWNEIESHLATVKQIDDFTGVINCEIGKPNNKYVNDGKVTDHHAIIPTANVDAKKEKEMEKMKEKERITFMEICKRFVSIFLPTYKYKNTEVVINIEEKEFISRGNVPVDQGWKILFSGSDQEPASTPQLPSMKEGEEINIKEFKLLDKQTKSPIRYGVGNIISLMEKYSIGTSATQSELIKKLIKSGYIEDKKGKYFALPLGREYVGVIPDALKTPTLTAQFEERLKQVNEGKMSFADFQNQLKAEQVEMIEQFKGLEKVSGGTGTGTGLICPLCGKAIAENSKAYSCTGWKEGCKFTVWKVVSGKKLTDKQVQELIQKGKTSAKVKGFKKKDGSSTFDAYLVIDQDGKIKFDFGSKE